MPEHRKCAAVSRHCMVVEVAADDSSQPLPLLGDRLVHASPHLLFDYLELRPHAVAPSLPFDLEFVLASLAADEGVSRPAEFHRRPLAEPSVRLSPHSAPIKQTRRPYRVASERRDPDTPLRAVRETGPPGSCVF